MHLFRQPEATNSAPFRYIRGGDILNALGRFKRVLPMLVSECGEASARCRKPSDIVDQNVDGESEKPLTGYDPDASAKDLVIEPHRVAYDIRWEAIATIGCLTVHVGIMDRYSS